MIDDDVSMRVPALMLVEMIVSMRVPTLVLVEKIVQHQL